MVQEGVVRPLVDIVATHTAGHDPNNNPLGGGSGGSTLLFNATAALANLALVVVTLVTLL
jgi:hypothetical protein